MSDNSKLWTPEQLSNLNAAWFGGRALRYCDHVSGGRCIALRSHHQDQFAPLSRIVWGWCGGSAANGVLWDVNNPFPRPDRTDQAYTPAEVDALNDIDEKRQSLPKEKAALLTDAYILNLLNRRSLNTIGTAAPSLGLM